ncbi:hypothetical protein L7F22_068997 [Adiantum nelumboides]|nr:hypothetical protein [Adiantum nelumboides]
MDHSQAASRVTTLEQARPSPPNGSEDPHLDLLQRVTNQLDNLSINFIHGFQPQQPIQQQAGGLEPNGQVPRRPLGREYQSHNYGEDEHDMYFCPYPRGYGNAPPRGPQQQISPLRTRPPRMPMCEQQQQQQPIQILRQSTYAPVPQPTAEVPSLPHDGVEQAMNVISCEDKGEENIMEAEAMPGKQATVAKEPRQMTTNDGANKKKKKRKKKASMTRRKIGIINFPVKPKPQDLIEEFVCLPPPCLELQWRRALNTNARVHPGNHKLPTAGLCAALGSEKAICQVNLPSGYGFLKPTTDDVEPTNRRQPNLPNSGYGGLLSPTVAPSVTCPDTLPRKAHEVEPDVYFKLPVLTKPNGSCHTGFITLKLGDTLEYICNRSSEKPRAIYAGLVACSARSTSDLVSYVTTLLCIIQSEDRLTDDILRELVKAPHAILAILCRPNPDRKLTVLMLRLALLICAVSSALKSKAKEFFRLWARSPFLNAALCGLLKYLQTATCEPSITQLGQSLYKTADVQLQLDLESEWGKPLSTIVVSTKTIYLCLTNFARGQLDPRDMTVWFGVSAIGVHFEQTLPGVVVGLQLTDGQANHASPKLPLAGSRLCICDSGGCFQNPIWATAAWCESKSKNITVLFVEVLKDSPELSSPSSRWSPWARILHASNMVVAESPAYYRAYEPVLKALQRLDSGTLPFQRELGKPPDYLNSSTILNWSCLSAQNSSSTDGELKAGIHAMVAPIPRGFQTILDQTQLAAVNHVLQNQLAMIQGPPGTGKTFLSVKIVELQLSADTRPTKPVLMVAYKNKALDQFLESCLDFCPPKCIVRDAAINQDILAAISPSIVVEEEAAEILEPQLMALLSPNEEHLILVGDHKQLRPSVECHQLQVKDRTEKFIQQTHSILPVVTKIEKVTNRRLQLRFLQAQRNLRDSSKSAQQLYTKGSNKLLLCEVLIGRPWSLTSARPDLDYMTVRQKNNDSVFSVRNNKALGGTKYDEYVIYNPDQALPKYVVQYKKMDSQDFALHTLQTKANCPFERRVLDASPSGYKGDTVDEMHFRFAEAQFFRMSTNKTMQVSLLEYFVHKSVFKLENIQPLK